MLTKSCAATFKSFDAAAADDGTFEAIVSVFGNVDYHGDVVMAGAFTDSLSEWKASGDAIPVLWSHRVDDPAYNIGYLSDAAELAAGDARIPDWADPHVKSNGGLWVKGQLDTGPDASPIAVQARRLMKARRVRKFSYAYELVDGGPITVDGAKAFAFRKLRVFEVSPTQVGANDLTELLAFKAATGWVHNDGNAAKSEQANAEEPTGANAEEPARFDAGTVRQLIDLAHLELEVIDAT